MREILFRGKRKDNGDWAYGYIVIKPYGSFIEKVEQIQARDNFYHEYYPVIPETVCQFTGLHDKNGKKIFEGDVLHIAKIADGLGGYYHPPLDCPVNVAVKWDLCAWMWETLCENKRYISFPDAWCHYECEIIGNIHDKKLEDFENGC